MADKPSAVPGVASPAPVEDQTRAFLTAIVEQHACNDHQWLIRGAKDLLAARSGSRVAPAPEDGDGLTVADINAVIRLLDRAAPSADGSAAWAERKRIADLQWKLTALGHQIEARLRLASSPAPEDP